MKNSILTTAFSWLRGANTTGATGNQDHLTDQYRSKLPGLPTPAVYTTAEVDQEVQRASFIQGQVELGKLFHQNRRLTIQGLEALDQLTTETALEYSDKSLEISNRRAKAQGKLMTNTVAQQINDSRVNARRAAFAQGLKNAE